jgi:hypothetical protein
MIKPTDIVYESKRKYFAHLPASVVKATFKHTTQNMRLPPSSYLHKMFKSPNPSANLKRRDEANATDLIYSDTPAINGGEKCAHLFVGRKSKLTDAYKAHCNSSAEFLKWFQDRLCYRGCPTGLEADNAPMYRGWKNSHFGNVNQNISTKITLKIDGKLSNNTQIALWIAAGVLRTFGF